MSEDDLDEPDLQYVQPFVADPPLKNAPDWAQELAHRQSRDRHALRNAMSVLRAELKRDTKSLHDKLGSEPDSDGHGGKGVIGDLRRMGRDLAELMKLKTMGVGAVGAVTIFGAIIIAGLIHLVQGIVGHAK